ncbi:MAG: hypothetical protein K0Q79_997 [Flavipsychrobacter sp.]|jgi:hypothetical protein|nr:hypothetical protein [Flavipsychrobacter sp.]
MKHILSLLIAVIACKSANAQITITAADMPVAGDILSYSIATPGTSSISLTDTGAGIAWDFSGLMPASQAADTYRTAFDVNLAYALVGLTAYGYKVADASPIPIPIPGAPAIEQVYTFFEKRTGPNRYQAKAFAATIAGIPTPINYALPDVWYFFPLSYLNKDSSNFRLNITLPGFGGIKQQGVRRTRVDGWGTIVTPYFTTPVNCIRVRSVIQEVDSVQFASLPAIGIPRNTVEYKWLVNGEHYPALWVTASMLGPGGETVNSIRYRDNLQPPEDNAVPYVKPGIVTLKAYPNPVANGIVTIDVPVTWGGYTIEVYDMQSKLVATFSNSKQLDIHTLPGGQYLARISSGASTGYAQIVK